jgi:hypothetical protein
MVIKNTILLINNMLILGIYKDNLETLIDKCKQIIEKDYNISHKQYFYDLISDLEENYINLIEDDLYITENIVNIKKFLLTCN